MNEDLLQDLALYKKSHEKAVSVAARSLIGLFREVTTLAPCEWVCARVLSKHSSTHIHCPQHLINIVHLQVCLLLLVKKDRAPY